MPSVLVVDENSRVRGLVADALVAAGGAVVAVRDGVQALALMEHAVFDAVVIEMIQPEGDSFSAIASMRERWPNCLVVAISAGGRFVSAAEVLEVARVLGAHARLVKPVSLEELRGALAPVLSTTRTRRVHQ